MAGLLNIVWQRQTQNGRTTVSFYFDDALEAEIAAIERMLQSFGYQEVQSTVKPLKRGPAQWGKPYACLEATFVAGDGRELSSEEFQAIGRASDAALQVKEQPVEEYA